MHPVVYYILLIVTMAWQINSYSAGLENEDIDNDYPEYSIQNGQFFVVQDQMESLNRKMYKVNRSFDKIIGMSLIKTYKNVIPPAIKLALQSSINNFQEPGNIFNFLITGNLEMAINSFWRFFINSIFGIFGIFDVAAEFGLNYHAKTFESFLQKQTKSDVYFFVPILGPSTIAGAIGLLFDFIINPLTYIVPGYIYRSAFLLYVVQVKSEIFDIYNNTEKNSLDPYAAWRSYYTQYKLSKLPDDQ